MDAAGRVSRDPKALAPGEAALSPSPTMNHFQTILTQVRMLLSSHRPSQVQALLDNLLAEELLSREYHYALLQEPDGEALARKISLTLLEKGAPDLALLGWVWSALQTPAAEKDPGYQEPDGKLASPFLMGLYLAQGSSLKGTPMCVHLSQAGKADLDRNQGLWLDWQEQPGVCDAEHLKEIQSASHAKVNLPGGIQPRVSLGPSLSHLIS